MTKDELIQELYDCLGEMDYWAMQLPNTGYFKLGRGKGFGEDDLANDHAKAFDIRVLARQEFGLK
jgi:hypothetical protein